MNNNLVNEECKLLDYKKKNIKNKGRGIKSKKKLYERIIVPTVWLRTEVEDEKETEGECVR